MTKKESYSVVFGCILLRKAHQIKIFVFSTAANICIKFNTQIKKMNFFKVLRDFFEKSVIFVR